MKNMDFRIDTTAGQGEMTFDPVTDIRNNIFLSIKVRRGSFFANPSFGLRAIRPAKNTIQTAGLLREYCREALQWLIDTGKAVSVDVQVERDPAAWPGRMKILVTAVQADLKPVTFETFQEVI